MPEWIQIESGILAVVTLLVAIGVWLGRITANQNYFKDFMKEIKGDLHVTQSDLHVTQSDLHVTQSDLHVTQKDLRETQSVMREIQSNLREINNILLDILSKPNHNVLNAQSPLRLSELGQKILKELNADDWVDQIAQTIQISVENKDVYGVQKYCFRHAQNDTFYSDDQRKQMRSVAYENGVSEFDVRRVIGLELRDAILKSMKIQNI